MSGSRGLDSEDVQHLMTRVQDGVVSRRQLVALDVGPNDIRRMLRRRELATAHPGVYVNHTGPLTWEQRAWAAVLVHWPAALARESALPDPPRHAPIQVAIDLRRSVDAVPGVVARRTAGFVERQRLGAAPPRIALPHAAIDVALTRTDVVDQFRVFADVCQTRQTSAAEIRQALLARRGVAGRALLAELLHDLEIGACSVLEREYLLLERRHGLPVGRRQADDRAGGVRALRDVSYDQQGIVVELDGRAFHDNARARDRDFERDLDAMVEMDLRTIRLTHGQVLSRGCRTIRRVATMLERHGWQGPFRPCQRCVDSRSGVIR